VKFCRDKGGKLAEIITEKNMDALSKFLYDEGSYSNDDIYWIGLTDKETEGKFVWTSTGKEANYTYWKKGEPNGDENEDCVHLESYMNDRKWNDRSCDAYGIDAICQMG
jgi:hypothetical protein